MLDGNYLLIVVEPSGRSVRRIVVTLRSLKIGLAALLGLLVVGAGIAGHGLSRQNRAAEAVALERENRELREIESELRARMPNGREMALHAQRSFTQLWAKSGLGAEPRVLGVGPVEESPTFGGDDTASETVVRASQEEILALEYSELQDAIDRLGIESRTVQTSLDELLEYFNDAELLLSSTPSVRPVRGGFMTSSFGKRRDPFTEQWVMHKGVDIGGRVGMEIIAPADGICIQSGFRGGYGQSVVVHHGYGLQTHYGHLSKTRVRVGDRVRRGDRLGDMGNTGRSTGAHLHYEVRRHGQPLNPTRFILD